MGSVIGILSTVILVSTVCTLIFAVGAYILARNNRDGVNVMEDGEMLGEDLIEDQFPRSGDSEMPVGSDASLFKRMQPNEGSEPAASNTDDEYQWK